MKRILIKGTSLLMATVMIAAFAVGCGANKEKTGEESTVSSTVQETTVKEQSPSMSATLKMAFPGDEPKAQNSVNDAISAKMKSEGLDFKFEYTFIPWDQYWNKLALIAAGGEDYDITWEHVSMISGAVAKNMLAPLDDALKNYGQDIISSTPEYAFKESTFVGKKYSIPRVVPAADSDRLISIRGDLRKKYNVPEIKTIADLEVYFAAIKANEPTMVTFWGGPREIIRAFAPSYYFPIQDDKANAPFYIDLKDKNLKVNSFYESEVFKNICAKYNEWVQKGYSPKDLNVIKDSKADFSAGKLAACFGTVMWPTEVIDTAVASNPKAEIEEVLLNPDQPKYVMTASDNLLSVFANSTKVNESVAFINWFRKNQENYDLFTYGIKDTNWKQVGEGYTIEGISPENAYTPISWAWVDLRFNRYSAKLDPNYVNTIKNWDKNAVQSPLLGFVLDKEAIKADLAKMATIDAQYAYPIIKGLITYDSKKDEMISKMKAAGSEKIIAEIQKQVDAFAVKK